MEECLSQQEVVEQLKGSLAQLSEQGKTPFQFEDLRQTTSGMAPNIGDERPVSSAQEGVAIGENSGQHVGSLPRRVYDFEEGNPLGDQNMLGKETHAPKPVARKLEEEFGASDEEAEQPTSGIPTIGMNAPSEIEPQFVGHVAKEEDMKQQYVYFRPASGNKVLVIDRERNE